MLKALTDVTKICYFFRAVLYEVRFSIFAPASNNFYFALSLI
jgi:hypothetical protein